ncbi:TLC domain-containing protein 4-like [Ornithorhynchus anatinus]|uniref:TLC domain-containing protein 4-like n=1 Tax=Ornithorhynchus anatinus TaxID=9258 RepID=UPI0010A84722|nr:TLC domain-containing protein 4-like [Ornithorhynchus anatinus]
MTPRTVGGDLIQYLSGVVHMEESILLGYLVLTISFAVFQLCFSVVSPRLSSALSHSYQALPRKKHLEWDSRCVSTIHATIISFFSLYILQYDDAINANKLRGDPKLVRLIVAIASGYLLYDLLLLLRFWSFLGDGMFLCHHVISLFSFQYQLITGALPYFANFRLLCEFSTPFVNFRWFLDVAGWPRSSPIVFLNGLAMAVVFFIARIAVIPTYYHHMLAWVGTEAMAQLSLPLKSTWVLSSLGLEILNIYWMYRILRGLLHAFRSLQSSHRKD